MARALQRSLLEDTHMKTLNIAPYAIVVAPARDGSPEKVEPYPVKDALINILFARPALKARDILERDAVARKILVAEGPDLLLEDAEFALVKDAVDTMEGFGRNDAELCRRVLTVA